MPYTNDNISVYRGEVQGPPTGAGYNNPWNYGGGSPLGMMGMMPQLLQMLMMPDSPLMRFVTQQIQDSAAPSWMQSYETPAALWNDRPRSVVEDSYSYMDQNPDVWSAYQQGAGGFQGMSPSQASNWHAQNYGAFEGRDLAGTGATDSGATYFQQNPDVAQAYEAGNFGQVSPLQAATMHAQQYGANEARDVSMFSGQM